MTIKGELIIDLQDVMQLDLKVECSQDHKNKKARPMFKDKTNSDICHSKKHLIVTNLQMSQTQILTTGQQIFISRIHKAKQKAWVLMVSFNRVSVYLSKYY